MPEFFLILQIFVNARRMFLRAHRLPRRKVEPRRLLGRLVYAVLRVHVHFRDILFYRFPARLTPHAFCVSLQRLYAARIPQLLQFIYYGEEGSYSPSYLRRHCARDLHWCEGSRSYSGAIEGLPVQPSAGSAYAAKAAASKPSLAAIAVTSALVATVAFKARMYRVSAVALFVAFVATFALLLQA